MNLVKCFGAGYPDRSAKGAPKIDQLLPKAQGWRRSSRWSILLRSTNGDMVGTGALTAAALGTVWQILMWLLTTA